MRLVLLLLVAAMSGCFFEPGLGSSPMDCMASTPLDDGFRVTFSDPSPFVGYCLEISNTEGDLDSADALRKVAADGIVYLPIDGAGEYYLRITVEHAGDGYCAEHFGEFIDHPGTGLVDVAGDVGTICA